MWACCIPARAVALVHLLLPFAVAQDRDLTAMSLEDFMRLEVVSVQKSRQRLSRTAAAVHVITQEDIRRSGATSLPEALRLAPGVHVARMNGSTWAVGIRGFNNFYSNKLLVMIDGRTIYNPIISGVLWSRQFILLEDVERIEVIRGPAGTIWGANAVSGVINIITKQASDTRGVLLAAAAGTFDPLRVSARFGARVGKSAHIRFWIQHNRNGQALMPPGSTPLEDWVTQQGGVRLDWDPTPSDEVTLQTGATDDRSEFHLIRFPTPFTKTLIRRQGGGRGGFAAVRWKHTYRSGQETVAQVFHDTTHADVDAHSRVRTADFDIQHAVPFSRPHTLLLGGGSRFNDIATAGLDGLQFSPPGRRYRVLNAFVADEWQIRPDRLLLHIGAKWESYTLAGNAVQPTVRLLWTPGTRQSYWINAARAVRAPSHADQALQLFTGAPPGIPLHVLIRSKPSPPLEWLNALEAGGRWQLSRRAAIDASLFWHQYKNLQGYRTSLPATGPRIGFFGPANRRVIETEFVHLHSARNAGGETSLHYDLRSNWRIFGAYSTADSVNWLPAGIPRESVREVPRYFPRHMGQVRSQWDLARGWKLDMAWMRTGRLAGTGPEVSAGYARVDFRVARKLGESSEFSFSGQNLLRPHIREFPGSEIYANGDTRRNLQVSIVRWF